MEQARLFGAAVSSSARRFYGAAGAAAASFGTVTGTGAYTLPVTLSILAVVVVAFLIFIVIQRARPGPKKLVAGPVDLFQPEHPVVVDRGTTTTEMTGSYTLGFFLRVDTVPDMRAASPLMTWPGVWSLNYNPAQEQLVWTFQQTRDGGASGPDGPETVTLSGVPLQKWTQVVMVFEGRTVDLFVDGALIKTATLANVPPSASASITLVPGVMLGQLAVVQLWSQRLTSAAVAANYAATADTQGRPYLPVAFTALHNIKIPNLFCPSGNCGATRHPSAKPSQAWEFPYA